MFVIFAYSYDFIHLVNEKMMRIILFAKIVGPFYWTEDLFIVPLAIYTQPIKHS